MSAATNKQNQSEEIDGALKAALLLVHLNGDDAAEMFSMMTRREIRMLSMAARDLNKIPLDQVEVVLTEFVDEMYVGNAELRGGAEYVVELAEKSLGVEKAREVLQETESDLLLDALSELDTRTLGNLLRKEHPQTVALILSHLDPVRAGEVLSLLPEEKQPEMLRRVAKLESVSPDVIKLLADAFVHEVQISGGKGIYSKVGGINVVADIMNSMEKSNEQQLMTNLEEIDQTLADEVRQLMFVFDDIVYLDDRGIQTLLKEIDRETLVLALKAADEELKERVFKNLSSRAVEMIIDDMEGRGPVRLSDVEKAQGEIVQVALKLSDTGLIELTKGDGDDFV